MIRINLLPIRQLRKKQQMQREVFLYVAAVLLVGFICVAAAFTINLTLKDLQTQNRILSKKKASYQPILNQIDKLKKEKELEEKKLTVIKKLKAGSQITVRLLDEIARLTPANRLWLNSLRQTADKVNLNGIALDNATIAQFMERISGSPFFADVELSRSSQSEVAGAKLKSFSLTLAVKPPQINDEDEEKKDTK